MMRFILLLSLSIDAFQTPSPRTAAVRRLQQHSQHRNTRRSPSARNTFALRSTLADTVISAGVSIDTFLPQFFWLPMIAFPRAELTKRVNGNLLPVLACSLVLQKYVHVSLQKIPEPKRPKAHTRPLFWLAMFGLVFGEVGNFAAFGLATTCALDDGALGAAFVALARSGADVAGAAAAPVSYTHLTLPTKA